MSLSCGQRGCLWPINEVLYYHFPIGILGQVWYLIVSIPDLCTITYFYCMVISTYLLQATAKEGARIYLPPKY